MDAFTQNSRGLFCLVFGPAVAAVPSPTTDTEAFVFRGRCSFTCFGLCPKKVASVTDRELSSHLQNVHTEALTDWGASISIRQLQLWIHFMSNQ